MLNGDAHQLEVEELRIRPLPIFQTRKRAHLTRKARTRSHQSY
jgi:hypothetical protein